VPLTGRAAALAGLLCAAALAAPAWAACSVEVAPVAFGVVDTRQGGRGTGEVVVRCDAAASFAVEISAGDGGAGAAWRMSGGDGARLEYGLYANAGRSVPWGDGGSLGGPVAGSSDGSSDPTRLTIYGEVPAQTGVEPGEYGDSLAVTLTF
jgi:spore coat protein U-like protein